MAFHIARLLALALALSFTAPAHSLAQQASTSIDSLPPNSAAAAPPSAGPPIEGAPKVVTTGRLEIQGRVIELEGVDGLDGRYATNLSLFIGEQGGRVSCRPVDPPRYRCTTAKNVDLSAAVLFNGSGRLTPDAPSDLRSFEERARARRVGIWSTTQ